MFEYPDIRSGYSFVSSAAVPYNSISRKQLVSFMLRSESPQACYSATRTMRLSEQIVLDREVEESTVVFRAALETDRRGSSGGNLQHGLIDDRRAQTRRQDRLE